MTGHALHGVNLTGWLTLEPWVTPELFADSGALDESSLILALGTARYQELVEHHRSSFLSSSDFTKIAARGFNAVRLQVPWYVFATSSAQSPYVGCIEHVDRALEWAEEVGLKLVLSVAASPGRPDFDDGLGLHDDFQQQRKTLLTCIGSLAQRYALRDGLFGLEVLDRPLMSRRRGFSRTGGVARHQLRNYYRDAYDVIRASAGNDVVIILPDAEAADAWHAFMTPKKHRNVWLSCQLFHNTDNINASGPSGVRRLSDSSRNTLAEATKSGLPVAVSGWSGSLPYADALMTPEGRIALERVYISEQIAAFRGCAAWFFQTWKTSGRLSGWDARVSLATFERRMISS